MKTYILYKTRQQAENAAKETAIKTNGYISQSFIDGTSSDFEQMFYHAEITGEFSVYKIDASNGDEYYYAWIYESEREYRICVEGAVIDYLANICASDDVMNVAGIQDENDIKFGENALWEYNDWNFNEWECDPDGATSEQAAEDAEHLKDCVDTLISLAKDLASDDDVISQSIDEINYTSLIKRECQEAAVKAEKNFSGEYVEYFATSAKRIDDFAAWLVTFEDKAQTITSAAVVCDASYYDDDNKKHHYVCFIDDWQGSYPTSSADFADYHWVDEHWQSCDPSDI